MACVARTTPATCAAGIRFGVGIAIDLRCTRRSAPWRGAANRRRRRPSVRCTTSGGSTTARPPEQCLPEWPRSEARLGHLTHARPAARGYPPAASSATRSAEFSRRGTAGSVAASTARSWAASAVATFPSATEARFSARCGASARQRKSWSATTSAENSARPAELGKTSQTSERQAIDVTWTG